ncbi:uncharacterized protein EKO05_0008444 [Ascochyta rabiei]|nr:uncharacterized protein EKO05_0008444 [Ascochyta rabiei]UPX18130.1 hypothetical protein EKO05_0008444 [Ascochyta rabiei]
MSYGPRARDPRFDAARRKSAAHAHARDAQDPTLIPGSSYFGFLGRLPFKLGGHGLRYKPSAADLTDHPGAQHQRRSLDEEQPLIEDSDEDRDGHSDPHRATTLAHPGSDVRTHRRARSDTHTSGHTTDSFSSRGDIFPSEDELDDAVPLDDEFTIALERRTTGQWDDGVSPGSGRNTRSNSKRPSRSASSRTVSSGKRSDDDPRPAHASNNIIEEVDMDADLNMPTLDELSREEDQLRRAEEAGVARKRHEAKQLALQRGLAPSAPATPHSTMDGRDVADFPSPSSSEPVLEQDGLPHALDAGSPASTRPSTAVRRGDAGVDADSKAHVQADVGADGDAPVAAEARQGQEEEQEKAQRKAEELEDFVPARLPRFG